MPACTAPGLLRGRKVGEIAATMGGAALVLSEFNLDLCSGNDVALETAAQQAGADLASLEQALGALDAHVLAERPPQETNALIAYILSRYHDTHRRELPALVKLARKVETRHAAHPEVPRGLADALQRLLGEIEVHMKKEELILFPAMRRHPGGALGAPITQMRHDHDDHAEQLRDLEAKTGNFIVPEGACGSWQALYAGLDKFHGDMMEHVRIENDVLFPRFEVAREQVERSEDAPAAQTEAANERASAASMADKRDDKTASASASADPLSGASLVPMLVGGLVLIVVAMIIAVALS